VSLRLLYLIFNPGLRLAGPARPLIGVEERGTAGAAARGRRAAPHQAAAPARLGDRAVGAALIRHDHPVADLSPERIKRRPVLGGLINEYERAA
jgi:hypothetical protein